MKIRGATAVLALALFAVCGGIASAQTVSFSDSNGTQWQVIDNSASASDPNGAFTHNTPVSGGWSLLNYGNNSGAFDNSYSASSAATSTANPFNATYTFYNVPAGTYNVAFDWGKYPGLCTAVHYGLTFNGTSVASPVTVDQKDNSPATTGPGPTINDQSANGGNNVAFYTAWKNVVLATSGTLAITINADGLASGGQVSTDAAAIQQVVPGQPTATGTATPSSGLTVGQAVQVTVTATPCKNLTISSVTLDASQLGVADSVTMNPAGGNVFTCTVTVGAGTVYGTQTMVATVTDGAGLKCQAEIPVVLPAPASYKTPDADLAAWRSNRFGMFVHWGPVTLTGLEISYSRANTNPQCPNHGPTSATVYDNLYTQFNPTSFDAAQWVAAAKAAGMQYIVLVAKHCDGFLLWDSKASAYNIMNSPFHRDVCGELAAAAHAAGMKIGWYFSPMDWKDTRFRNAGNADFIKTMQAELRELLTNYGKIDILWFDTDGYSNVYDVANTYAMCRTLQPDIVINNRLDMGSMTDYYAQAIGSWADYSTPEQSIGAFNNQQPWETCMTLGTQWAWKPNDTIKSVQQSLNNLLQCAGGDGNLLYNLGPQSSGAFEQRYIDTVTGMGDWLALYGESVYGTRGGPYLPGSSFSSTRKGNAIYLHLMPPQSHVTFQSPGASILSASVLTGGSVAVSQTRLLQFGGSQKVRILY